jgi:methyl-accepting chemotaxis protein
MKNSIREDGKQSSSSSLSIKAKLRLVFLMIAGLFIGMAVLVNHQMDLMYKKTLEINENWMPSIAYTGGMDAAISKLRLNISYYVLMKDPKDKLAAEGRINKFIKDITELREKYQPLVSSPEEKEVAQDFSTAYDGYLQGALAVVSYVKSGENEKAIEQIKKNGPLFVAVGENLEKLVNMNRVGGMLAGDESEAIMKSSVKQLTIVLLLLLSIILLIVWWFETKVSKPLGELTSIIQSLANGETSVNHGFKDRSDEVGQMAKAVTEIADTLQALSKDALTLIESAQQGILSVRVDVERHPGEFGIIVTGMNRLIEELSKPLTDVAQVMQQLALGNLKGRMQGAYEGDLRALKANVNRSLDTLVNLLEELGEVTKRLANGDLTRQLTGSYQGDFSDLKRNVNQAVSQLQEVLSAIVSSSEHISTASIETFQAASQVASQSMEQMSSLEQIAVVIEETAVAVSEISVNASEGSAIANSTAELAEEGRLKLGKLISIIAQVAAEYKQIESTTAKITRIADKTHLLSLNAGLEAVRAGEHGLGFGFVAQQIGKLAEEAAISARDIGTVIAGSSESVQQSVASAQETRTAIEQIAKAASASGATVHAISAGIAQQSAATESLSEQVARLQAAGEENASAAEQISGNMQGLAQTVEGMVNQVNKFTLA